MVHRNRSAQNMELWRESAEKLLTPVPSDAHSDIKNITDLLQLWLRMHGVVTSTEQWREIEQQRFPELSAQFYPDCRTPDDALRCCITVAWLHMFDDQFDKPPLVGDVQRARSVIDAMLARSSAVRAGDSDRPLNSDGAFGTTFTELLTWATEPMSSVWGNRYLDHIDIWLRAYVTEAEHRAASTVLTPDKLIRHKRVCMAVDPSLDLFERLDGQELSPRTAGMLRPMSNLVCDFTGAVNDVVSLGRERLNRDSHNLVESYIVHTKMSEEDAIAAVQDFAGDSAREMLDYTAVISPQSFGSDYQSARNWAEKCCKFCRGYYNWVGKTSRFISALVEG
jgi:terpene synthase-like protein